MVHRASPTLTEAWIEPANVTFFEWLGWLSASRPVAHAGIAHQRTLMALASELPDN